MTIDQMKQAVEQEGYNIHENNGAWICEDTAANVDGMFYTGTHDEVVINMYDYIIKFD